MPDQDLILSIYSGNFFACVKKPEETCCKKRTEQLTCFHFQVPTQVPLPLSQSMTRPRQVASSPRADVEERHPLAHEQLFRAATQPCRAVAGSSPQGQTCKHISVKSLPLCAAQVATPGRLRFHCGSRTRRPSFLFFCLRLKRVVRLNSFTATFCCVSNRDKEHCC